MEVEVEAEDLKKILLRPFITIVIRRAILQENTRSLQSQKTSIGPGNLRVGDWC